MARELRSFHIDFDKGIFTVNGEQLPLRTRFRLENWPDKLGPAVALTLRSETYFSHVFTEADFERMGKAAPNDGSLERR